MKKKLVAVLAITVMMTTMLAGCGNKNKNSNENEDGAQVTLTWQSYDSYDKYEKVVEAFEKENPDIKIKFEEFLISPLKFLPRRQQESFLI